MIIIRQGIIALQHIILADNEYKLFISTIIENTSILRQSDAEVYTYNHLAECKLTNQRICIIIEPPETYTQEILTILDTCEFYLIFPKKSVKQFSTTEREIAASLLGIECVDDLQYLIRNVNEPQSEPTATAFPENLHLNDRPLIYHETSIKLD